MSLYALLWVKSHALYFRDVPCAEIRRSSVHIPFALGRIVQALIEEVTQLSMERDRLALDAEAQRSEIAERRELAAAELAERRAEWQRQSEELWAEWERQQRADADAMHKLRTETQVKPMPCYHRTAARLLSSTHIHV